MTFDIVDDLYIKEHSREIGIRIKDYSKYERKETNKDLAQILNFDVCTISRKNSCLNGLYYNRDDIEKLAEYWNVRKEFLYCLDKYDTIESMLNSTKEKEKLRNDYLLLIDYLKSIGIEIKPAFYWRVSEYAIYKNFERIKPFLNNLSLDYIKKRFNNFVNFDENDTLTNCQKFNLSGKWLLFPLKSLPDESIKIDKITKQIDIDNYKYQFIYDENDGLESGFIELRFNIIIKGYKEIKNINIIEFNNLSVLMDNLNKNLIESFNTCYGVNDLLL